MMKTVISGWLLSAFYPSSFSGLLMIPSCSNGAGLCLFFFYGKDVEQKEWLEPISQITMR